MPYEKIIIQFKDHRKFRFFSQTGSQFVYACAVDLRTRVRKGEGKPSRQTTFRAVIFACEWVFWSAHFMMTSVTGSIISLP